MASRKFNFAEAARTAVTAFAEAAERIAELDNIYTNSGYESGGSDEIVADDLEGHDITVQDLTDVSIFAVNLDKFLNNDTPATVDYISAINKFRNM